MEASQGDGGGISSRVIVSFDIGIKNLAVAILEHQATAATATATATLRVWKIISLAEKAEKIPGMNELSERLFMALDCLIADLGDEVTIDTVLLENQPARLNGTMKSIQMIIFSYFQLRKHWEGNVGHVAMVSASNKLQTHTFEPPEPPLIGGKRAMKGYEKNKWRAIEIARDYIKDDADLSVLYNTHKKKDDLADALLQAISYLRKGGCAVVKICGALKST